MGRAEDRAPAQLLLGAYETDDLRSLTSPGASLRAFTAADDSAPMALMERRSEA